MSVKGRIAELNTRLADTLTEKDVQADGSETTTVLIDKAAQIPQGGGVDYAKYAASITFHSTALAEVTNDVYIDLSNANSFSFRYCRVGFEKLSVVLSSAITSLSQTFRMYGQTIKEIKILGDISGVSYVQNMCAELGTLERVTGVPFNLSNVTTDTIDMFNNCVNLYHFRVVENTISKPFVAGTCKSFDADTTQSIIDGFADMTGQTSPTLTLHPNVVVADEQKAALTLKNITLVQ